MYRCEAKSVTGFVQQLACAYLRHGYHWYVTGYIPKKKNPREVDARMLRRFEVDISRWARARRKKAGQGNCHFLRYGHFHLLLATSGEHPFWDEHTEEQIRNIRYTPLAFAGYSIAYHRGVDRKFHVSVRIHPERYKELRAYFGDIATKRSVANLEAEFRKLHFEAYAPVRRQLLNLLRYVNKLRKCAQYELVPTSALRLRRRIVKPFGVEVDLEPPARRAA